VRRALLAFAIAFLAAAPAFAQWQIDAYLGAPLFRSEDITVEADDPYTVILFGDLEDEGEVTAGARVGYFWNLSVPLDLGVALDASGVFGKLGNADHNFVPVSALMMARLRMLPSEEFPGGRLHPYVGVGPSAVWSNIDLGLMDDTAFDIGADVRGGVRYGLIGGLGIFGEYRYTWFEPHYEEDVSGLDSYAEVDLTSSVHHLNFGFSWGF
jgi:hypothetical protein